MTAPDRDETSPASPASLPGAPGAPGSPGSPGSQPVGAPADPCAAVEPLLPLLRWADDLTPEERVLALSHLEGCAACRVTRARFESTAAALEVAPLRHPAAGRVGDLRERVLAAAGVAAACPRELDLLAAPELDGAARADLDQHVAGCASCADARRAFCQVGVALDRVPVALPDAARLAALPAGVFARLGVPAPRAGAPASSPAPVAATPATATASPPAGRFVRWPVLRVAAAALVAFALGLGAPRPSGAPLDRVEVLALREGADRVLTTRGFADPALSSLARAGYATIVAGGERLAGDPEVDRAVAAARRELAALDVLADAARGAHMSEERKDRLEAFLCEHATAQASFRGAVLTFVRHQVAVGIEAGGGQDIERVHRFEDMIDLHHLRDFVKDQRIERAIEVRLGIEAEEQGDWDLARNHYQRVIEVCSADTPAGRLARVRLEQLPG